VEQIAVRLTALGIGTCYIGSLGREAAVRDRHGLPKGTRIGAFLTFGLPSSAPGSRLFNTLIRTAAGATNKMPVERIFFRDTFDAPATPPANLVPLIEAARHAPSAVNAQPWRFLWHDGRLYMFVRRKNLKYGPAKVEYRLYDGAICMANVALALEALGMEGHWQMLAQDEAHLPDHPPGLQPMAMLAR
jgi:nitroreductase